MKEHISGRCVVIEALVGSHNYNLNTEHSDLDFKYFVTPSFDDLYTGNMFSTAKQSDTVDYDCHDIRQLGNLLWKANINFVEVLFSKQVLWEPRLEWIFTSRDELSTMNLPYLYRATIGMHYQKIKDLRKGTAKTMHLVNQFGYDTKQATHAMRCLLMVERLASGMSMAEALWFEGEHRNLLLSIKNSELNVGEFTDLVDEWRVNKLAPTEAWFMSKSEDLETKHVLDETIKRFVRGRL